MAAGAALTAFVDQLVELFNRRSMDLPDGVFTRNTRFFLNGVPFEERLGREPNDPLVKMLTRGAVGYRFTVKAVQHAVPDAIVQRGELEETIEGEARMLSGQCWLSGHYRGAGELVEMLVGLELRLSGGTLESVKASIDPALLQQLQAARLRS
jgi:hypothetical protein